MHQHGRVALVRYGFHPADLLSGSSCDNYNRYDVAACAQKYTHLCQKKLKQEYPDAKVEVLFQIGASGVLPSSIKTEVLKREYRGEEVYETSDPSEIEVVEHLCGEIYREYKWVVPRPWLTIEKAHERFSIPIPIIRWACQEEIIAQVEKNAGGWEFPLDAFSELRRNITFVNCKSVIGASVTSDGTRTFKCYSEDTLDHRLTDFPVKVKTLAIVSNRFGIPLFTKDNSNVLISKRAAQVILTFEHFLGETPWTDRRWSYGTYVKALVHHAEKYEFSESGWQENEHLGGSFIESVHFKFRYNCSYPYTLYEAVNQAANVLKDVFRETEIHLSGGPVWKKEYEEDEALFCREVLAPLLRKMGFESVRYTHGPKEFGRDFVFSEVTKFGELQYYGLQAQAGNVRGKVNSEVELILGQVKDTFEMPYREIGTGAKRYISVLVIAISGHFTENAKEKIREKMPGSFVGSVYFWDKDKILTLIANHWSNRG